MSKMGREFLRLQRREEEPGCDCDYEIWKLKKELENERRKTGAGKSGTGEPGDS